MPKSSPIQISIKLRLKIIIFSTICILLTCQAQASHTAAGTDIKTQSERCTSIKRTLFFVFTQS